MVAGSPGLGPVLGAVFAVHRLVGAVVQRLHALHSSGLVAQLPAGLAAGTPLLHHPPEGTVTLLSGLDALALRHCSVYLHGRTALLDVAALADGFWLFADFTEVAVHQAAVTLPPASIFSVLHPYNRRNGDLPMWI